MGVGMGVVVMGGSFVCLARQAADNSMHLYQIRFWFIARRYCSELQTDWSLLSSFWLLYSLLQSTGLMFLRCRAPRGCIYTSSTFMSSRMPSINNERVVGRRVDVVVSGMDIQSAGRMWW